MKSRSRWKPVTAVLVGAGLLSSLVFAATRSDTPYVDPLLIPGSQCKPQGERSRTLIQKYQMIAAAGKKKSEVGPFDRSAQAAPKTAQREAGDPPLWDNLGTLSYPITATNDTVQAYFDQGLRLTYAFNHGEALRAFRMGRTLDPNCAMCWWGEALVQGPNINWPMEASAVQPAYEAISHARAAARLTNPREQGLIEALALRYSPDPKAERPMLDAAYAEAMGKLAQRYPDDQQIAVLYAESLMDLSPWDYWEAGGAQPKGNTAQMLSTLERVLAANPEHPGAAHYYIHIVEASTDPRRAEPYADRLGKLMLGAGHLVHMPSHIYYRVGRYLDSLATNKAAVQADESYLAHTPAQGVYPSGLYPHNIHFLLVSAQMAGDGVTAISAAEKLSKVISDEAVRTIPWVQPIKAAPYFAHAQFSGARTILALSRPSDEFPYVQAMWHYARGVAHAMRKDFGAAQIEAEAIARLAGSEQLAALAAGGVPAPDVLNIARLVVLGRMAQARGDLDGAIAQFAQAVAIEDKLAYMEPPFWYYPLRQSLGAALLAAGQTEAAEEAFRESLARTPNNGWALYGLMELHRQRGDRKAEAGVRQLLERAWAGNRKALNLNHL